ncbi:hypothetical protein D3C84_946860 [compost metagenome]
MIALNGLAAWQWDLRIYTQRKREQIHEEKEPPLSLARPAGFAAVGKQINVPSFISFFKLYRKHTKNIEKMVVF